MCRVLRLSVVEAAAIDDVRAYLLRAIRNQCITQLRTQQRRLRSEHVARQDRQRWGSGAAHTSHDARGDASRDEELRWLVEQLPRGEREVVVLKHSAGLSLLQIGAALDVPKSTVASRYQAGLDRLRRWMNEREAATSKIGRSHNLVAAHNAEGRPT
ncbi:MAG: RNA polymerase sigma factor [Planctomycetes bacterium]|nr:RNA polymerase sigma factor [Planctomycetota bacterium]